MKSDYTFETSAEINNAGQELDLGSTLGCNLLDRMSFFKKRCSRTACDVHCYNHHQCDTITNILKS